MAQRVERKGFVATKEGNPSIKPETDRVLVIVRSQENVSLVHERKTNG